ncbi:MAG: tetratricopeptide repeat protein [Treponema sp.]|nr:tetratricopeptide repeat protein [Treponema sp.]
MNKLKEFVIGILILFIVGMLVRFVYLNESTKSHRHLAKRISELSPRGGPPETIDGLRKAIALYEAQIELNVKEGAQTGSYWKILAIRLADKGMHQDALAALERAIYYNAEEAILYNLTGVSAGIVAKSIVGFSTNAEKEREHYYRLSENSYLRAMQIDELYLKPMYGLAVLYVFELDRPAEAIPYLERYLKMQTSDISAMFILARAYYLTERFSQAIELYDRIIARTKDAKIKAEAQNNRDIVMRLDYE